MKSFLRYTGFILLVFVTVFEASSQYSETFTVDYEVLNASCFRQENGSININSFSCVDTTNSNGANNCFDISSFNAPELCGINYDYELNNSSGNNYTLSSGSSIVIKGSYSGNIQFHGGKLVVCGLADLSYISLNAPTEIIVLGELVVDGINCNGHDVSITNYGVIEVSGYSNFQGSFTNYGTFNNMQGVNLNSVSESHNYGTYIVTGGNLIIDNGSKIVNHNSLVVNSSLTLNSGSELFNYCSVNSVSDLTINSGSNFSNFSEVTISGRLTLNSASSIYLNSRSLLSCEFFTFSSSELINENEGCSKLEVRGNLENQNGITFNGNISFCANENQINSSSYNFLNGASINCECELDATSSSNNSGSVYNLGQDFDIIWNHNGDTSKYIDNLRAGQYTALISSKGCSEELIFRISEPDSLYFITGIDSATCEESFDGGIQVMPFGGEPPYNVVIGGINTMEFGSAQPGSYLVSVTDDNGCMLSDSVIVPVKNAPEIVLSMDSSICWSNEVSIDHPTYLKVSVENLNMDDYDYGGNCWDPSQSSNPYDESLYQEVNHSSNYYELSPGSTERLSSNFDGYIKLNGGTLVVTDSVFIDNIVLESENDKIVVLGTLVTNGINFNRSDVVLENYGKIKFPNSSFSISGIFKNYGSVTVGRDFNLNSQSDFSNYGEVKVSENFNINNTFSNYNKIIVDKDFHMNSNASCENYCDFLVGRNVRLDASAIFKNHRKFTVNEEIIFNSNTVYQPFPGSELKANKGIIDDVGVIFQNQETSCSKINFTNSLVVNNPLSVEGEISLCVSSITNEQNISFNGGAGFNCLCNPREYNNVFTWDDGTHSDSISITNEGTYYVNLTLGNCVFTDSIVVDWPNKPEVFEWKQDILCNKVLNTGAAKVTVENDSIIQQINWFTEDGQLVKTNADTVSALVEGIYRYNILFENGCEISDTIIIKSLNSNCDDFEEVCSPDLEIKDIQETCYGNKDGLLVAQLSDSLKWYNYSWKKGTEKEWRSLSITTQEYGEYNFEITFQEDGNVCFYDTTVSVTAKEAIKIDSALINPSFENHPTGSIQVFVSGVENPKFSWERLLYNNTYVKGLESGTYNLTVKDGNCIIDSSFYVSSTPDSFSDTCDFYDFNLSKSGIDCYEANNGKIEVYADPSKGYNLKWYKNDVLYDTSSIVLENLSVGLYQLKYEFVLNDSVSCLKQDSVNLRQSSKIDFTFSLKKPQYENSNNGAIQIFPTGGKHKHKILWDIDDFLDDKYYQGNLSVGNYEFIIEDDNGCILDTSIYISSNNSGDAPSDSSSQPPSPPLPPSCDSSISLSNLDTTLCSFVGIDYDISYSNCYQKINVVPEYYTYLNTELSIQSSSWLKEPCDTFSTLDQLNTEITGLYYHLVTVEIGDETCNILQSVNLTPVNSKLNVNPEVSGGKCNSQKAKIELDVDALHMPYEFLWNNESSDLFVHTGLNQGQYYSFSLTGADECNVTDSVFVPESTIPCSLCDSTELEVTSYDIKCNGNTNGEIWVDLKPSSLSIKNSYLVYPTGKISNGKVFTDLEKGKYVYYASLIDTISKETCSYRDEITIKEPEPLTLTYKVKPSKIDVNTGEIEVSPVGGNGEYNFSWAHNDTVNTSKISGLGYDPISNYKITITDKKACSTSQIINMSVDTDTTGLVDSCDFVFFNLKGIDTFCEKGNNEIDVHTIEGTNNFTIELYDSDSTLVESKSSKEKFTSLNPGKYYLLLKAVIDTNACLKKKDVSLFNRKLPSVSVIKDTSDLIGCSVKVKAQPAKNYTALKYVWNDNQSSQTIYLPAEEHSLKVTSNDMPGCVDYYDFNIDYNCDGSNKDSSYVYLDVDTTGNCSSQNIEYKLSIIREGKISVKSVEWQRNGIKYPSDGNSIITSTPGVYKVTVALLFNGVPKNVIFYHTIYSTKKYNYKLLADEFNCDSVNRKVKLSHNNPGLISSLWFVDGDSISVNKNNIDVTRESKYVEVYIRDQYNCMAQASIDLIQDNNCICDSLNYELKGEPVSCNGYADGELKLTLKSDSAEISSSRWKMGGKIISESDSIVSGLSENGNYLLESIVNFYGEKCTIEKYVNLNEPDSISAFTVDVFPPSCEGKNDGQAVIETSGGTGNITFYKDGDVISLNALPSGINTLKLIDDNDCEYVHQVTIPESDEECEGEYSLEAFGKFRYCNDPISEKVYFDVYIKDNITGRVFTEGVNFKWINYNNELISDSNVLSSEIIADELIIDTTYKVIAEFTNGLETITLIDSFYIEGGHSNIELNITSTDATLSGYSDGSIIFDPIGGTYSYYSDYSIVSLESGVDYAYNKPEAFGLPTGDYLVSAQNADKCFAVDTITISEVIKENKCKEFDVVIDTVLPTTVNYNSGELRVTEIIDPTSYSGEYKFLWTSVELPYDSLLERNIDSLPSGQYWLNVSQLTGQCKKTKTIILEEVFESDSNEFPFPDTTICTLKADIVDFVKPAIEDPEVTDSTIREWCQFLWDEDRPLGPQPSLPLGEHQLYLKCDFPEYPDLIIDNDLNAGTFKREGNSILWAQNVTIGAEELGFDIMEDDTICFGEEIFLATSYSQGTYNWYSFDGSLTEIPDLHTYSSFSVESEPLVKPSQQTSYVVKFVPDTVLLKEIFPEANILEKQNECTSIEKVVIDVDEILNNGNSVDTFSVCKGNELSITIDQYYSIDGNVSINWMENDDIETNYLDQQSIVTNPDESTRYIYRVSSPYGCVIYDTLSVEVRMSPQVNIPDSVTACYNTDLQLTLDGGAQYKWIPSTFLSSDTSSAPVFNGSRSVEYIVSIVNAEGCEQEERIKIKVNTPFKPVIEIDESACLEGNKIMLVGSSLFNYEWSPEDYLLSETIVGDRMEAIFESTNIDTVQALVFNDEGCQKLISTPLLKAGLISAGSDRTICLGQTLQLEAENGFNHDWYPKVSISGGDTDNPTVQPIDNITYTLKANNEFNCETQSQVTVNVDPTCDCYETDPLLPNQKTFFWRSGVIDCSSCDNNWYNLSNWSLDADQYVSPERSPTTVDNVVVGDVEGTIPVHVSGDPVINNICVLGGSIELGNSVVLAQNNGTFTGGEVKADQGKVIVDGKEYNKYNRAYFSGTQFESFVSVTNTEDIFLNGSVFKNTAHFSRNGNDPGYCSGNNEFFEDVSFENLGEGDWFLSYYPNGGRDRFYGDANFNTITANINASASYSDEYHGDITVSNELVNFGSSGGTVIVKGENLQSITTFDENTDHEVMFNKLVVNKSISSQNSGLSILTPIRVKNTLPDNIFTLNQGIVNTYPDSYITIEKSVSIEGGSINSFINGPLKIIKEGTLDFPVGKVNRYRPIILSNVTGSNLGYLVEFIEDDPIYINSSRANKSEELVYLSECEYWTTGGAYDKEITPILTWDSRTCEIPSDLSKLQVASFNSNDNIWGNIGNGGYQGSKSSGGQVQSESSLNDVFAFALGSSIQPGQESPSGFSFNVYGAKVQVQPEEHLMVYGNVLNDKGGVEQEIDGEVYNQGKIYVEKDWTNNANNWAFVQKGNGEVRLIGFNQRLRGSNKTLFHDLYADGFGKKTMYQDIDIDTTGVLFLQTNEVATRDNILYVRNNSVASVQRVNSGFVSSKEQGFLSRNIKELGVDYVYPVGKYRFYRPVILNPNEINSLDSSQLNQIDFGVRFVPYSPDNDSLLSEYRSPFVESVNPYFYHLIKKNAVIDDLSLGEGDGISNDTLEVAIHFDELNENYFQAMLNWNDNVLPEIYDPINNQQAQLTPKKRSDGSHLLYNPSEPDTMWQAIPSTTFETDLDISESDNTPTDRVRVSNVGDFNHEPFALGRRGFVLQTNGYGDPDNNGAGVTYSLEGESIKQGAPTFVSEFQQTTEASYINEGQILSPDVLDGVTDIVFDQATENNAAQIRFSLDNDGSIDLSNQQNSEISSSGIHYILTEIDPITGDTTELFYELDPDLYKVISVEGYGSILVLLPSKNFNTATKLYGLEMKETSLKVNELDSDYTIQNVKACLVDLNNVNQCNAGTGSVILDAIPNTLNEFSLVPLLEEQNTEAVYLLHIQLLDSQNQVVNIKGQFIR